MGCGIKSEGLSGIKVTFHTRANSSSMNVLMLVNV